VRWILVSRRKLIETWDSACYCWYFTVDDCLFVCSLKIRHQLSYLYEGFTFQRVLSVLVPLYAFAHCILRRREKNHRIHFDVHCLAMRSRVCWNSCLSKPPCALKVLRIAKYDTRVLACTYLCLCMRGVCFYLTKTSTKACALCHSYFVTLHICVKYICSVCLEQMLLNSLNISAPRTFGQQYNCTKGRIMVHGAWGKCI